MIERFLEEKMKAKLGRGKALVLMGARQTGKTTLIRSLVEGREGTLWLNGDENDVRALFENISATRLKAILGQNSTLILDEAQRIRDIGLKLKLLTDQLPHIQLIATGSSSFDLANQVNEPLTGRKWEYILFPLSFGEMAAHHSLLEEKRLLPHRLVYGYYPDVIGHPGEEKEILQQLSDSYLYKDVLAWERIKKSEKLVKLLQALAFQVGNQVSYPELGQMCGLDYKTTEKYILLLEQAYVVFRLGSFSRNLRNELKASRKIYFIDNGIRNAVVADFRPLELRNDAGALWENFMIVERMKKLRYREIRANCWFWRTQRQQEIDYLEEADGRISACEFKWNPSANFKQPRSFIEAYPKSSFSAIHRENFEEFLL
ncbi:MAG: ATP-binding protein [Synergistaceae bacterium]|jgi:predicted AAA+ superfamily ATPase|nr:ATP-binding protein [Synergistaceae bacterium]